MNWADDFVQDARYAVCQLRAKPGFAAVAVLSLALGIGANTAIFSIVDAVLLKNLPVSHPEQLRVLTWTRQGDDAPDFEHSGYNMTDPQTGENVSGSFSYRGYELFRDRVPALSNTVGFAWNQFTVTLPGKSDYANGEFVSGNYFTGLGVRAILGRTILPGDDSLARPAVAVLTYRSWLTRFRADPGVVGSNIFVNQRPVTIVGVLQPHFEGVTAAQAPELFLPFSTVPTMSVPWYSLEKPNYWWIQVFARVKPGVSDAAAQTELNAAMQNLIRESGSPESDGKAPRVFVRPGAKGVDLMRDWLSKPLLILSFVVILVLMMSCANVANLLLARGIARAKEFGIRLSMGARRQRIIRQLVTESLFLGIAGASIGVILAQPLMNLVLKLLAGEYALAASASLDLRTLVFTLLVSVFTALLFGIMLAWQSARIDVIQILKADAGFQRSGPASVGLGRLLVSLQVALSLTLLIGAGLFVRTLLNLSAVDLGFQTDHLLVFQTDGSRQGYHGERLAQIYTGIIEKLATIPGVNAVAASQQALMQGYESDNWVVLSHPSSKKSRNGQSQLLFCSSSFLSTLRIPILQGRDLLPSDAARALKVAIVNREFVHRYLPPGVALGEIFHFGDDPKREPIEIVGIAGDAHYTSVRRRVQPTIYLPMEQYLASLGGAAFFLRTAIPPLTLANAVRSSVRQINPMLPVAELRTEDQQIKMSLDTERLFAGLISSFGLIAVLLAAIGLYGAMAYTVLRRTSEIGIRVALGAQARQVQWLVMKQSLFTVLVGIVAGCAAALSLAQLVGSLLYGIKPADPQSILAAVALLMAVAAIAAWVPMRRAIRVEPTIALRYE